MTASPQPDPATTPTRDTYRHGDLRRVLLDAGVALARESGPQAVVLREVTRRVGVVPNAAYRHFASRQALIDAVRAAALAAAACCMEDEFERLPVAADASPAARARARLQAVGFGYLRFAYSEPGLFRTAFIDADVGPADPAKAGRSGLNPFELLGAALDDMVGAGLLPAERRAGAQYLAWSAVHGLALLVLDGPLRAAPEAQREALGKRLLEMVEKGL